MLDATDDGGTRAQHVAFGVLALALVLLGGFTLWNFLGALAWAGIFAIALWPLYCRVRSRFQPGRHKLLLPALFTLAVALLFIVPLVLVGVELAHEAHGATDWLRSAQQNGIAEPDVLRHLPFEQAQVDDWWRQNLADPGSVRDLVDRTTQGHVADFGRRIGAVVLRRLTVFVFTLLTLFFLFKEGESLTAQVRRATLRAFGPGGERVGQQIVASVHGTVNGLVLVGLGEGVLLGIVYAVAGVPHPTVFGALTGVAAMIPFAAPVVFGIAALIVVQASVMWAIVVLATGMVVTFVADHFVRPALIGGATKLPFIWVLLGILGGIEAWGLLGLFLGPAIMAALILLWREWAGQPAA
jgi:predicted PurR-regulated permease PerM